MICNSCEEGRVPLGEHFISVEMCIDGGIDTMHAGESMGIEWGQCPCCYGIWQECDNCRKGLRDE